MSGAKQRMGAVQIENARADLLNELPAFWAATINSLCDTAAQNAVQCPAIRLASAGHVLPNRITVDIEVDGKFVTVIEEAGDIFCHIVEPLGIAAAIAKATQS